MKEIQAKSILVRVSARFELSGVSCTTSTNVEERLEIWTVNNAQRELTSLHKREPPCYHYSNVACEQVLCLGKGWKNREEGEGKGWEPVDKHWDRRSTELAVHRILIQAPIGENTDWWLVRFTSLFSPRDFFTLFPNREPVSRLIATQWYHHHASGNREERRLFGLDIFI